MTNILVKEDVFCEERSCNSSPRNALFLDRDGVIIEDKCYISRAEDVVLCPGIEQIILNAKNSRVPVIVVTNQSGIGRGYFSWQEYDAVNNRIIELLNIEKPFAAIYANSLLPGSKSPDWRKPCPGMFLRAAEYFNINLPESILIGDRLSDLRAGYSAGLLSLVHVLTGHGINEKKEANLFFQNCIAGSRICHSMIQISDLTCLDQALITARSNLHLRPKR